MARHLIHILFVALFVFCGGCKALRNESAIKIIKGPNLPTGLFKMGYATDGKIIFSIGGSAYIGGSMQSFGEIYLFSPFAGGWEKAHFTDKPIVKGQTNSVYLPDFNIVLSTGFADIQKGDFYTFPIEIINLGDYRIQYLRDNPHWAKDSEVVYWNKKAYVLGGIAFEDDGSLHSSNRLMSYDPGTGQWEDLASMPSERVTYGVVVGNNIYTFGGFDENNTYADVWRYDFEGDTWETVGYLPYPVSHFSITQKYPYVFLTNVGDEKNVIGRVDIRDGTYKEFKTWITVYSPGSAIVGDYLYLFGGSWDYGYTASNKTFKIPLTELMVEE
ncbi:MAG: kelch repeat-containing protein [Imperialibacter sp.]|uniref:Kelch repeat-containing protein n=1 Tax=Imperialibacter sp. TaxID=2038411 RepID=UPI0032EB2229